MSEVYEIEYSEKAYDDLADLDRRAAQQIRKKLAWLAQHIAEYQHKSLKGQWAGFYSLHVMHYRVIYALDHELIILFIEKIGHRREVYDE